MAEIMEYEKVVEILELYPQIDKDIRFLRKFIKDMNDEYYTPSTSTNYEKEIKQQTLQKIWQ